MNSFISILKSYTLLLCIAFLFYLMFFHLEIIEILLKKIILLDKNICNKNLNCNNSIDLLVKELRYFYASAHFLLIIAYLILIPVQNFKIIEKIIVRMLLSEAYNEDGINEKLVMQFKKDALIIFYSMFATAQLISNLKNNINPIWLNIPFLNYALINFIYFALIIFIFNLIFYNQENKVE